MVPPQSMAMREAQSTAAIWPIRDCARYACQFWKWWPQLAWWRTWFNLIVDASLPGGTRYSTTAGVSNGEGARYGRKYRYGAARLAHGGRSTNRTGHSGTVKRPCSRARSQTACHIVVKPAR